MMPTNFDRIQALIAKHRLSAKRSRILAALKPSLRLALEPDGGPAEVTASRFGGAPALRAPELWPRLPTGKPLVFLGQINLRDLPAFGARDLLPERGLLSFFYDAEGQPWGDREERAGWRVIDNEAPESAILVPIPNGINPDYLPNACKVRFTPDITVPTFRSIEIEALELESDDDSDRYAAFREDVLSLNGDRIEVHRMIGHPDAIQGCMQRTVPFASRGLKLPPGVLSWYEHPQAAELIPGAFDWRLLFQLDTSNGLGVMWGDAGRIYYWIHRDALAQRRFEEAWLFQQSY
jgi:hypothetical protein